MARDNHTTPAELILKKAILFTTILLLAGLITCGLEMYVVQPGNRIPPATALLILSLAPWIGVFGLASVSLVFVFYLIRRDIRARHSIVTPVHDNASLGNLYKQEPQADYWTKCLGLIPFNQELVLIAGSECQCPWEELQAALAMSSKDNVGSEPAEEEEREVCECVTG